MRVHKTTLREIHKAALNDGKTVKHFVLNALQEKGVTIAELALTDDGNA